MSNGISNNIKDVILGGLLKTLNHEATTTHYEYVETEDKSVLQFNLIKDGVVVHTDEISLMESLSYAIERLAESRKEHE